MRDIEDAMIAALTPRPPEYKVSPEKLARIRSIHAAKLERRLTELERYLARPRTRHDICDKFNVSENWAHRHVHILMDRGRAVRLNKAQPRAGIGERYQRVK